MAAASICPSGVLKRPPRTEPSTSYMAAHCFVCGRGIDFSGSAGSGYYHSCRTEALATLQLIEFDIFIIKKSLRQDDEYIWRNLSSQCVIKQPAVGQTTPSALLHHSSRRALNCLARPRKWHRNDNSIEAGGSS